MGRSKRLTISGFALGALWLGTLAGCNTGSGSQQLVEKPGTTGGTGDNSNSSGGSTDVGTTASSTSGAGSTTGTTGTKPDPNFKPNRSFQLGDLQVAMCTVKGHKFRLWVMDTNDKRMEGMMQVENKDFSDDQGMVFVFASEAPQKFWMHNTLIDLDIAYCGRDGTINTTYTMKALDETTDYSSKKPSQFVIELRAGTLKKFSIGAGDRFAIPAEVVAKD